MKKSLYIDYLLTFLIIPFWKWGRWKKRKRFFETREPIGVDNWLIKFSNEKKWDKELSKYILENMEILVVAPAHIRPTDRFDNELSIPSKWSTAFGDYFTLIEEKLNKYEIKE